MVKEPSELIEFLRSRRSSKFLSKKDVRFEDVVTALSAAITAPNAHNSQPWRFIVIDDVKVVSRLLEEMAYEWRKDLMMNGYDERKVEHVIRASMDRTLRASLWIVVCLTMEDMDRYPDERRNRAEYVMAVQSVAAAIENMLLAFHALGYGACWRCGPLFAPDAVRRVLEIPEHVEPQALIEVGGMGGVRSMKRKGLNEVAYRNRWGNALC